MSKLVGIPTNLCDSTGVDTPHSIQLDRSTSISHRGNSTSVCPNHIYHMTVSKTYSMQQFVVLQATPGTATETVFSELQATRGDGSLPMLAVMHETKFRRSVSSVYPPGTKLRVQVLGCAYAGASQYLIVEEVSTRCYWGRCVRKNPTNKKAFLEIEVPTSDKVEVDPREEGETPGTISRLLKLAVTHAAAVEKAAALAAKKKAQRDGEDESSEEEIDYSNDTKKSKKKNSGGKNNKKNNKKNNSGGNRNPPSGGGGNNEETKHDPKPAPKAATAGAGGSKAVGGKKLKMVPSLLEVALNANEGTRLDEITSKVPPFSNGPLPRVGDRCLVGVTATLPGVPPCVIIDFPYSTVGGNDAKMQLSNALGSSEVNSDSITTCLVEGLDQYEADDCSADGGDDDDDDDHEEAEGEEAKPATAEDAPSVDLYQLITALYPLEDSSDEDEEEDVNKDDEKKEEMSGALKDFMEKMDQQKKKEEAEKKKPEVKQATQQTKPKATVSKKQLQRQKEARAQFRANRVPQASYQDQQKEPEVAPEEKFAAINADYESLKEPIINAGGVTNLGEFQRKLFFENSMKILYRLDALEGLDDNLRAERKGLVTAVQAMQDEATATLKKK